MKNKAVVIWKLCISTCMQASGAPLIDKAFQESENGNRYESIAILLQPWRRNKYNESLPQNALVIGWQV